MSIYSKFNEFNKEVLEYLAKKLPKLDAVTVQEIASFVSFRTGTFLYDSIAIRDDYWTELIKAKARRDAESDICKLRWQMKHDELYKKAMTDKEDDVT